MELLFEFKIWSGYMDGGRQYHIASSCMYFIHDLFPSNYNKKMIMQDMAESTVSLICCERKTLLVG
jgi:hypothetical protein